MGARIVAGDFFRATEIFVKVRHRMADVIVV
jgi:hypothetical protein